MSFGSLYWRRVMRLFLCLVVSVFVGVSVSYGAGWTPTLEGTISKSHLVVGETATITYSSPDATGCQFNITQWGNIIGWSDGVGIPTSGQLQITPAVAGEFVITITAAKRRLDLNKNGKHDGRRRTTSISFPVVVTDKVGDSGLGRVRPHGKLWFDPPVIKRGESTTRSWTSGGGYAYLDGQLVPNSGSQVLAPEETLRSVLQVTAGRRWKRVYVEWASVEVVP